MDFRDRIILNPELRQLLRAGPQTEEERRQCMALGFTGAAQIVDGVILDVDLDLRDNVVVEKRVKRIDYRDYGSVLRSEVLHRVEACWHRGEAVQACALATELRAILVDEALYDP